MTLGDKFKQVRKLLNLTQNEMGTAMNIPQKVVSIVENNGRETIPTEYFYFLAKNNIDINSIFDNTAEVRRINTQELSMVAEPAPTYNTEEVSLLNVNERLKELECIVSVIRLKFKVDDEIDEAINSLKKKSYSKRS